MEAKVVLLEIVIVLLQVFGIVLDRLSVVHDAEVELGLVGSVPSFSQLIPNLCQKV